MKSSLKRLTILLAIACIVGSLAFAQAEVSQKKEIAIFALGYYGWNIPSETLGTIDVDIQRVFLDLGRFTILGMEKRFSAGSVEEFMNVLKKTKEANFVLPEKYQFGEEFLTEADFNKLVGAFIIAIPVVTSFNSEYVSNKEWRTNIKTNVTFIDVSTGNMMGIANVETFGSSKETQYKSISSAIDGIPSQLQYEIRSVREFQNVTRVLASDFSSVDMQLGQDMGIKKGDEYAVIVSDTLEGFEDEREVGLLVVKEVGSKRSKATILYSSIPVVKDVQLREIPRLGMDFAPYLHTYSYFADKDSGLDPNTTVVAGFRAEMTRGFYGIKPYAAVQLIIDTERWVPINAIIGAQFNMYLRRLELGGRAGFAGSSNFIIRLIEEQFSSDDDPWLTHYGASAGAYVSYLFGRDLKIFAEVQADYMLGIANGLGLGAAFNNYGGYQIGLGVSFKM